MTWNCRKTQRKVGNKTRQNRSWMLPTQLMSRSARFVSNRGLHCYWLVVFLTFKLDCLLLKNINSKARASPDSNQTLTSLRPIQAYKFVHFVFFFFLYKMRQMFCALKKRAGASKSIYYIIQYFISVYFDFLFSFSILRWLLKMSP